MTRSFKHGRRVDEDGSGELSSRIPCSDDETNRATDEIRSLEEAFDEWDDDHDGRLSVEQPPFIFAALPEKPDEDEIEELLDVAIPTETAWSTLTMWCEWSGATIPHRTQYENERYTYTNI